MSSTTLLATDQQRSVLNTLKANHPPQAIAYLPYGHRPAACWILSLLGFNGEPQDQVTGHYLLGNGYRAFNPALLRFNSPDSLSPFREGGLNSYAYCMGDPVSQKDPTGHGAVPIRTLRGKYLTSAQPRRILRDTPIQTILLDEAPPSGRRVTGIEHGPEPFRPGRDPYRNLTNNVRPVTDDHDVSRIINSGSRQANFIDRTNPTITAEITNAAERPAPSGINHALTHEANRLRARDLANLQETPNDPRSTAFEIRRRDQQRGEGDAFRRARPT